MSVTFNMEFLPHQIIGKELYVKNTGVKVRVNSFIKLDGEIRYQVHFLEEPNKMCYEFASHGSCAYYNPADQTNPQEHDFSNISLEYTAANLSNIPYDTAAGKVLFGQKGKKE